MPYYISPPPKGPLAQFFAAFIGVLAMVGAFLFGLVALAFVAGIAAVTGIFLWFKTRKLRRELADQQAHRQPNPRTQTGETIEAEYTVVSRHSDSN